MDFAALFEFGTIRLSPPRALIRNQGIDPALNSIGGHSILLCFRARPGLCLLIVLGLWRLLGSVLGGLRLRVADVRHGDDMAALRTGHRVARLPLRQQAAALWAVGLLRRQGFVRVSRIVGKESE